MSKIETPARGHRLRRIAFRSWHRGTREADYIIGGFADRHAADWNEAEIALFEALLDEQDVDILGWVLGTIPVPAAFSGAMMDAMRRLDYVAIAAAKIPDNEPG